MTVVTTPTPTDAGHVRMSILATLSRYGVRLPERQVVGLVNDLVAILSPVEQWEPQPGYEDRKHVKRKNPRPGMRSCCRCGKTKPLADFGTYIRRGRKIPKVACRRCLSDAQRNRYVSAKQLAALNAVRLELVADDEIAGLRCLDCGETIVAGDEVTAEAGLRHTMCVGESHDA